MVIEGFEKIFYLREFFIRKNCNEHAVCEFKAEIGLEDWQKYFERAEKPLKVACEIEGKTQIIFSGKVDEVKLTKTLHSAAVEVRAISLSVFEDETRHVRIWQNPAKSFGDIISAQRLALKSCNLELDAKIQALKYPAPVIQNQETNFEFMRRLASYAEIPLWLDDTANLIKLAETLSATVEKISAKEIIYYTASRNRGSRKISVTLKKYIALGTPIKIATDSADYVVEGVDIVKAHEDYQFHYRLAERKNWTPPQNLWTHNEKTIKLTGKVISADDPENRGRIQVSFAGAGVEDFDREKMWIGYSSPYVGIVFLPDKGDMVDVFFSNEIFFICSSSRSASLPEECRNVAEKYIGNNSEQRIFWQKDALKLASGKNTVVLSKDKIEMTSGESRLIIDSAGITIKTGGKIKIEAAGTLNLDGATINLG